LKYRGRELLAFVEFLEAIEFVWILDQSLAAGLGLLLLASELDVVNQLVIAALAADTVVLAATEFD
jgi:hypothetical protein